VQSCADISWAGERQYKKKQELLELGRRASISPPKKTMISCCASPLKAFQGEIDEAAQEIKEIKEAIDISVRPRRSCLFVLPER